MLNVFYRPEQCALQSSFSPSSGKPRYVVNDWVSRFGASVNVCEFEPVGREAFKLVHDAAMVDGVLDGVRSNGFGNTSAEVARALPYTTGSMLAAAEEAVLHRTQTCSPTSGFHHADFAGPQGFCTFNGLMVTAVLMKRAGLVQSVGILDLDAHYGNGTADIMRRFRMDWVRHHTFGAHFHSRRDVVAHDGAGTTFTRWLSAAIEDLRACDLILYQAGADPHVDDPLGGILTTGEMRLRDRMVFEGLRGKPLVWNLAGGYQREEVAPDGQWDPVALELEPVLALHRQTLVEHLKVLEAVAA